MAYPTTSAVLDNFDRANEGPPMTGWTDIDAGLQVISNAAGGTTGANLSRLNTSYGPDAEAWATVSTKPGAVTRYFGFEMRQTADTGDGYAAYAIDRSGTDTWEIYRVDNGTYTLLGSAVTGPEVTAGDQIGMERLGSAVAVYHFTAGAWTQIATRTDSTYTGTLYLALYVDDGTGRFDDFGGGTVVAAATSLPFPRRRQMGALLQL